MKITRIAKIKRHRVFDNFNWPADLPDFAQFNLIYGWNGSGKTTLSNLFGHIQRKEAILEGEADFLLDGLNCPGASLNTASNLPHVRVFNRNFVDASVFASTLSPIFFLGKDSVEKQKQVEELKKAKITEEEKLNSKLLAKEKAIKAYDDFCIREARVIKELLSSSGTNPYNNYNKADFKATFVILSKRQPPPVPLSEEKRILLKQQKDNKPKDAISVITMTDSDLNVTRQQVETLLKRTVVSQVLEELVSNPELAEWVQQGLGHHTGEKHSEKCKFCDSLIPEGRITKLEAHFNDEYKRFLTELGVVNVKIKETLKGLAGVQLPDKAKFYDHLIVDYVKAVDRLTDYTSSAIGYLAWLASASTQKQGRLFEVVDLNSVPDEPPLPDMTSGTTALESINNLIIRHNQETENFQKVVADARKQLEEGLVMDIVPDLKEKTANLRTIVTEIQGLQATIGKLSDQIVSLEKEIVEHRRPAEELNSELRSYLGRDELTFGLQGSGYQVMRHGGPAANLSEGERTAIAFLYFLKSLQGKEFTIANDIIVIDDPVSSLDANSLFCAFGYMKDRTKDAGQLFIFTHNFAFFRQAKNWFNHLKHQRSTDLAKRPCRFYMLEAAFIGGKRTVTLKQLDPLLHRFESEYHYLFKKVHEEASGGGTNRGLEECYGMPNIARRLLESFLAFRYPAESGELKQQIDLISFDPAKKARILRFLHTYSHDGKIAEPEHDLSILSETADVLKDLVEMMKAEDPKHYNEMEKLLLSTNS
jgi:wobble nucleotide-excising tRNase